VYYPLSDSMTPADKQASMTCRQITSLFQMLTNE